MTHTHPCARCGQVFPCDDAYLERNYDPDGVYCIFNPSELEICDPCAEKARGDCDVCGEPASITVDDADDASGYRGDRLLCSACADGRRRA